MGSEWKETKLVDVCSLIDYGYTESASDEKIGPKFLRITDIQGGVVNWDTVPYCIISDKEIEKYQLVSGDIVVARTGNSTGENYMFTEALECVFASFMIRFRVNPKIVLPKFVWYLMRSYYWFSYVDAVASGAAQKGANSRILGNFPFSYPKKETQEVIVKNLSTIDALIEENRKMAKCIQRQISCLFRSWFIDFDPVKAKAEGKLPFGMSEQLAALFPNTFEASELGPIPTGWRVSSISEICKMSSGGTPSRSKEEYFSTQGVGYPWLASRELNGNIIHDAEEYISELGLKNSSAKLFPENSVAMAMYGATAGRIGYFAKPLTTSQAICVMLAKENICLPKYLYFLIGSESWKIVWMNALGGAQPNISQQSIGKHRIVLPPFEIIQKFESLVHELFVNIDTASIQSEKLSEIREALLPRLMSGELSVS